MRKKILIALFLILAGLVGGAVWIRYSYLQPSHVQETIRNLLRKSLGLPIEVASAELLGVDRLKISGFRAWTPDKGELLLSCDSGEVRWRWIASLVGRTAHLESQLRSPFISLRHSAEQGWNFQQKGSVPRQPGTAEAPEEKSPERRIGMRLQNRTQDLHLQMDHETWGNWDIRFPGESLFDWFYQPDSSSGKLAAILEAKVQSGTVPLPMEGLSPFENALLATLAPSSSRLKASMDAQWHDGGFVIQSVGSNSIHYSSDSYDLLIDRFRVAGIMGQDEKTIINGATLDNSAIHFASWNSPMIARLRIPWSGFPEGPLDFRCPLLRYTPGNLDVSLADIRIRSVTIATSDLPWLRILTQTERWRLNEAVLGTHLKLEIESGDCEWDQGEITIDGGKGGTIRTRGKYRSGPPSTWEVTTDVQKFPIPRQQIDALSFEPGILTAQMTWGESHSQTGGRTLLGEGNIVLEDGEIGAIRMLGKIDELLDLAEVAHSRFSRLSFNFKHSNGSLAIDNLSLKSNLLDLEGHGVYQAGNIVDVTVNAQTSALLVEMIRIRKARTILQAIDQAESLQIRISGNLEDPTYTLVPGEGMVLPIEDLIRSFNVEESTPSTEQK